MFKVSINSLNNIFLRLDLCFIIGVLFSMQVCFWVKYIESCFPLLPRSIYYNPKFLHTCILGTWPSYFLFFPSHHWVSLLKNSFFEDVRTLHQYCLRTHACCTTTSYVRMLATPLQPAYVHYLHHYNSRILAKVAKMKKLQGIHWDYRLLGSFPTNPPPIAHHPTK